MTVHVNVTVNKSKTYNTYIKYVCRYVMAHRLFFNKKGEYEGEILNSDGQIIGTLTLNDKNSRYFNIKTLKGSDE